jgi:hypothetical protein
MPHAVRDLALHVGPEQHPVVHVCVQPEHAPEAQVWPAGQLAQVLPPLPHTPSTFPGWQTSFAQQPVGHEAGSHTHLPLRHCCPAAQGPPEPHAQAPAGEHWSVVNGSHAPHVPPGAAHVVGVSGVHTVPVQQPAGQDVASQAHAP